MARYEVAPTKTNLMRLKEDLEVAVEGRELIEQKREILINELTALAAQAVEAQKKLDESLARAYQALKQALLEVGKTGLVFSAQAVNLDPKVRLSDRSIMGVRIPLVSIDLDDNLPYYGVRATSVWTDEAIDRFKSSLAEICRLAELRVAAIRLATEVRKTVKRLNALEKIFIPDYVETIKYISDSLEEADRELFFILKLVKDRLESKRGGDWNPANSKDTSLS